MVLRGPIPSMLWRLAAPNVIAVAILTAVTFADAWFVGRLGTAALASLALVFPFQTLMQMMAGGAIGGGVTSALARALGNKELDRANSIAWHAVIVSFAGAFVFMLVLGFWCRPIFILLGGTGGILDGAVLYAQIAFGGAAATWFVYVLSAVLRGTGDTATPARAIIAASLSQIILSGLLTLGWGPIPSIGIAGPPAAMVLCQALAAIYLLFYLLNGRAIIRLTMHKIRRDSLAAIMQVGGIGLINSLTIALTVVTVTGFVSRYGAEALAGYGLGSRLELMLVPIAFGVGGALTAAVGINFGAKQFPRARKIAWTGAFATFVIAGLVGVAAALSPGLWLNHFTADPQVFLFGALYLSIVAPFYGLFGAGQTLYFASQGTGQMFLPVSVGIIRLLTVAGVGGCAIIFSWQVTLVFAAVSVGMTIIGLGLSLCMFSTSWRPDKAA